MKFYASKIALLLILMALKRRKIRHMRDYNPG